MDSFYFEDYPNSFSPNLVDDDAMYNDLAHRSHPTKYSSPSVGTYSRRPQPEKYSPDRFDSPVVGPYSLRPKDVKESYVPTKYSSPSVGPYSRRPEGVAQGNSVARDLVERYKDKNTITPSSFSHDWQRRSGTRDSFVWIVIVMLIIQVILFVMVSNNKSHAIFLDMSKRKK